MAVVWGIKKYRPYLEDRSFTDSKTLTWLSRYRDTKSKLTSWSLLLQEFFFTVDQVLGKENHLPDALSPHHNDGTSPSLEEADRLVPDRRTAGPLSINDQAFPIQEQEPLFHAIQNAQQVDPHCRKIARQLMEATPESTRVKAIYTNRDEYIRYREGVRDPIEVPKAVQAEVLRQYPDDSTAGHPGIREATDSNGCRRLRPKLPPL